MVTQPPRAEPTLADARRRLQPPRSGDGTLTTLAAAALAAVGALALAAAVILGPPGEGRSPTGPASILNR